MSLSIQRIRNPKINFKELSRLAVPYLETILTRRGVMFRRQGHELQMLNPLRSDRKFGSFNINTITGKWADFATDEAGGDVVSLVAYLDGCSQTDAAMILTGMLGVKYD